MIRCHLAQGSLLPNQALDALDRGTVTTLGAEPTAIAENRCAVHFELWCESRSVTSFKCRNQGLPHIGSGARRSAGQLWLRWLEHYILRSLDFLDLPYGTFTYAFASTTSLRRSTGERSDDVLKDFQGAGDMGR